MIRRLAFLHWLQPGTVRQLHRYYQDALTSRRPSRRASFPSLGGTSVALVAFAPRRTSAPPRPGVGDPVTPAGMLPRRRQDLASSWGTPIVRLPMFSPTPAGLLSPDQYGVAAWPLVQQKQRLPRKVFRRSIAWLSDSLSTLRRVRYLTATQDSLPAVGQTLLDGLSPAGFLRKVSELLPYISSPFPKLLAAMLSTCAGSDDPGLGQANLSERRRYDESGPGAFRRFVHQVDVTRSGKVDHFCAKNRSFGATNMSASQTP